MFERCSNAVLKSIIFARGESKRLGSSRIGTEELLLGLIGEGTDLAAKALLENGVTLNATRNAISTLMDYSPKQSEVDKPVTPGKFLNNIINSFAEFAFSPRAEKVLQKSLQLAQEENLETVETPHLLIALLEDKQSIALQALESLSTTASDILESLKKYR